MDKHWLPLEASLDDFGTDSAHYITISFDFAMAEEMDADRAFQSFRISTGSPRNVSPRP